MVAMVGTTTSRTARTTGTAIQEEDPDETQASISLPAPKANLAKDLNKTPLYEQRRLAAQLHAFLLQESPDLTQLNDAENKPVMGITNIPKSSTIRVLHSFGVGANPIGGSSPSLARSYLLWAMAPLLTLHKTWSSQGKSSTRPPYRYPTKMLFNTRSTTPRRFSFKKMQISPMKQ